MNCHETAALLASYSDGELDPIKSAAIEKHLLGCAECATRRDELSSLRVRIRAEVPYYAAPPALHTRVLAAAGRARPSAPARERWRWLSSGALAGCAATVLAWFLGTAILDWRAGSDLATAVVSAHARATLANRLIDVASSDRHTVKPWLSARLDYSPPVQDLAAEGFALTGGRLDYLDGRPVATLVYRYREHVIDVFVRPASAALTPSSLSTIRGFNVVHATGSGMDWWAVSDVSPDVLSAFVARLARDDGSR